MSARAKQPSPNDVATRGDVESIVTRVVNQAIDNFAIVVGRSFTDTQAQIHGITVELSEFKTEMHEFRSEMTDFKVNTEQALYILQTDVTDLKHRMGAVEVRLDGVEDRCDTMIGMWRDHEKRIVVLETD